MSMPANLTTERRQQFTRMETTAVPVTPPAHRSEYGCLTHTRAVATQVTEALRGTAWRAEVRTPYWPHPENETHAQITVVVDRRTMVTYTHRVPAYTSRDLFTLTVNGRPIPYYIGRGDLPHQADTIAANVFRHAYGITIEPCNSLMCQATPTVAIYGAALCARHGAQFVETGTW